MSTIKGVWKCITSQVEALQRSSQCLSVVKNTAYVFGGELKPREPRDNVVYAIALGGAGASDVEQVKAINASGAPAPRVGAASTAVGGKIYYFGGRGGVSMTCLESKGSFDVFDTAKESWSVVSPEQGDTAERPEDRSYHSMTSNQDHTIYLHAGCPAKGRLNDLWAFDISTREWRRLPSAPGGGRGGTSITFSPSGHLYRINGFDGKTEQGGAVDVFDLKQEKWSSIEYKADGTDGPEPRSVSAFVPIKTVAGRELLMTLFGEGSPSDLGHAGAGRMFSDVWAWDMNTEKWCRVEFEGQGTGPLPRGWFDAGVWAPEDGKGDQIVLHGGLHDDNSRLGDLWMLQID